MKQAEVTEFVCNNCWQEVGICDYCGKEIKRNKKIICELMEFPDEKFGIVLDYMHFCNNNCLKKYKEISKWRKNKNEI